MRGKNVLKRLKTIISQIQWKCNTCEAINTQIYNHLIICGIVCTVFAFKSIYNCLSRVSIQLQNEYSEYSIF